MKKLQKLINDWQRKTFGPNKIHTKGMLEHLRQEYIELETSVYDALCLENENVNTLLVGEELADIIILSAGLADAFSIDLEAAVLRKLAINKKRSWKDIDKNGVINHRE